MPEAKILSARMQMANITILFFRRHLCFSFVGLGRQREAVVSKLVLFF